MQKHPVLFSLCEITYKIIVLKNQLPVLRN